MTRTGKYRNTIERIVAVAAALFGGMTVFAASSVLSGADGGRAGATVALVLWTNLALGFAYIVAAVLLLLGSAYARPLAFAIAALTALAAAGFAWVAAGGAPVEPRTAAALAFRIAFWLGVALLAPRRPR